MSVEPLMVVMEGIVEDHFRAMLERNGWELFPIPSPPDDLPCFGVRAARG